VGPLPVFLGQVHAELLAARGAERDHFIGEMDGASRLFLVAQSLQALKDDVLQVGLAAVDDVVDAPGPTEPWRHNPRHSLGRGYPELVTIGGFKWPVVKIETEQSELPELVCDVFADIGDRAVGPDDDL